MANEEQLAILRQGVDVWNQWRKENLEKKLDLSGADLTGASLCKIDFRKVHLNEACLQGANLAGANLLSGPVWKNAIGKLEYDRANPWLAFALIVIGYAMIGIGFYVLLIQALDDAP